MSQIVPSGFGEDTKSVAYPLNDFYSRNGHSLPPLESIEPGRIPEPYRSLLVHQSDMTSTLEQFHRGSIRLHIVSQAKRGDEYFREVALVLEEDAKPVEFGAIRIKLDLFPPAAQQEILKEHWPLGRILKEFNIQFISEPRGFLRIASDKLIDGILHLTGAHLLYGRRNTLWNAERASLAEIVEILPPA
jgi:chorismate-pyruvate lyase